HSFALVSLHYCYFFFSFSISRRPPTSTLFPYTTLFRSYDRNTGKGLILTLDTKRRRELRRKTYKVFFGMLFGYGRMKKAYRAGRSEEHTSELQSRFDLVCRLLLEKKKNKQTPKDRTKIQ